MEVCTRQAGERKVLDGTCSSVIVPAKVQCFHVTGNGQASTMFRHGADIREIRDPAAAQAAAKWIWPRADGLARFQSAALTEIVKASRSLALVGMAPGGAPKMFVLAPLNRLKRNQVA